jgi:hypothetical protein
MIHHRPTILGALIGALLVTLAILALSARAHAQPLDAGHDPVVLADHAAPLPALTLPDEPPPAKRPGLVARALEAAGPVGRLALGGIMCLVAAEFLARLRKRSGRLRRGLVGNAAAAVYGALIAFGGVLALGGSVSAGLVAVGGATFAGLGLARDPETARMPAAPGEDVPT